MDILNKFNAKTWIYIFLGSLFLAAGFVLFINPYRIVPGGVYGMGIVLHYIFPSVQVGTFGFMFDIPLLLISLRVFGAKFGAKTVVAAVLTPLFMNLLTYVIGENPVTMLNGKINLENDVLLSCIFGGVLIGLGQGLIFRTHATTGGTDIIAMILSKYTKTPIARSVLYVDSLVVVFGLIVFGDWKLPLYSLITIFIVSQVIDYIIEGISTDKLLFIISDKHAEIKRLILDDLSRGGTYIKASGMYTNAPKDMIFVVINRREVSVVQDYIKTLDPNAFLVVVNAHETLGDGFKNFQDKVTV